MLTDPDDLPAELQWSDDSSPGIRRRRSGTGFSYVGPDGHRADLATVQRARALAIPPAWDDVWICAEPTGHLQATGRDARGRKQYRYHAAYRAHRDAEKFDRLLEFGASLGKMRGQVARDLATTGMAREKVVAAVVSLLEVTLVRVGNEEYARDNGSYGLTTLRNRHAKFTPGELRLVFKGKSGVAARRHGDRSPRCAASCGSVRTSPVRCSSSTSTTDGEPRPISSSDVNDYLRAVSGNPVTAKDFRTWAGTLLAADQLAAEPPPESEKMADKTLVTIFDVVSEHLRNTRAVCRASYVHPAIVEWYRDGTLADRWHDAPTTGSRRLLVEERRLLGLLRTWRRAACTGSHKRGGVLAA